MVGICKEHLERGFSVAPYRGGQRFEQSVILGGSDVTRPHSPLTSGSALCGAHQQPHRNPTGVDGCVAFVAEDAGRGDRSLLLPDAGFTIATLPAQITSDSSGHAATKAARQGS